MCSLILDHPLGPSVINYDDENGKTCVHIAAAAGYSDILFELARFGETNLQALDVDERTPLHWASAAGKEDCVQTLLQLGVEPGPRDINENTPLTYAMYCGHTACIQLLSADNRSDPARQQPSQGSDQAQKKEGKFRMLNQIFSCKRKKEHNTVRKRELSHDGHLTEETSEVDDIITMFDCLVDSSTSSIVKETGEEGLKVRKQPSEPQKPQPLDQRTEKGHKGLPPIRTQSLPPITLGNSLLACSLNAAQQSQTTGTSGNHFAHRSQKSKSEHDLFDNRLKGHALSANPWKTESNQSVLAHKSWISPPTETLLDNLLHETTGPLDVLCPNHAPYIQKSEQAPNTHLLPLDRLKMRETALTRNCLAPIRDHCTHRFSLPPDQVSKGVKKSKSLPLNTLGRGLGGLPPPLTSKSQRVGIPQNPSLYSFLPTLNGDPLRNVQVLPAIPSQRRHTPTVNEPKTGNPDSPDNRT